MNLKADKFASVYAIAQADLETTRDRKNGRPSKTENGNQVIAKENSFKTTFIVPELVGSIKKSGVPADFSSNKDYLKDLGKKSAEKKVSQRSKRNLKNE